MLFWVNLCTSLHDSIADLIISPKQVELAKARVLENPYQVLRELSLKRRALVLSERPSRSGEEVSPKRENVTTPLFPLRALV